MAGYPGGGGAGGPNGSGPGTPGGMGGGGELEALFAQLRQRDAGNGAVTAPVAGLAHPHAAPANFNLHAQMASPPNFFSPQTPTHHVHPQHLHQPQHPAMIQHAYQPPNLPLFASSPAGPFSPAAASAGVASPQSQPPPPLTRSGSNAARTTDLLSLLKFSQPGASANAASSPSSFSARETAPSLDAQSVNAQGATSANLSTQSANLLAAIMGSSQPKSPSAQAQVQTPPQTAKSPPSNPFASPPAPGTQAYLLSLLHRPKPPQKPESPLIEQSQVAPAEMPQPEPIPPASEPTHAREATFENGDRESSSEYVVLSKPEAELDASPETVLENKTRSGIFTYVNPFDALAASSPRNQTPKATGKGFPVPPAPAERASPAPSASSKPAAKAVPPVQILKNPKRAETSEKLSKTTEQLPPSLAAPAEEVIEVIVEESTTQQIAESDKPTETVSEALNQLGEEVDRQVEEALTEAEEKEALATVAQDIDNLMNAKSDVEFDVAAQKAATDLLKELSREGNEHVLEDTMPTPVAEAVKDLIDEAAHGNVADSWESADAEDSAEKEKRKAGFIPVHEFPVKPWMSLKINPVDVSKLPHFNKNVTMDIARLRKDFDQIDRTLATASNGFIVYGMSKNGGIRIIRQHDGKDAKLFAETHDRVFNVAISTTDSDSDVREAVIGTGVSGTVYWAKVRENDEDFTEEISEKDFFALPPLNSQDNESPGGVLKTRARKSNAHPDFFAVGRGKTIHIIWPSLILQKRYPKNTPEHLVDVDKYLKGPTLKINTGKAGKDFIFSPDDTAIVSLDKAGRVKFWDVRPLTNPDRQNDTDSSQNMEVKEPLQVLLTTQPTEKSWPTSVMLVDKLRPYTKGGPLRYLIVGMKQNHTLQLWDLSLGKPVQEIHFPHEKESDAICSIAYHPLSGIVTVGHPTRNSIYFLHLSAPKYALNKSLTQAEYIERIVAKDEALTRVDSTAVFSGIREYSLANKGELRSLDIIQAPQKSYNANSDDPLFELYAMHSKGVTCLTIKHSDLGWEKDCKVVNSVDAQAENFVTVESLKPLPAYTVSTDNTGTPGESAAPSPAASRVSAVVPKEILTRDSKKNAAQKANSATSPQKSDATLAVNGKQEQAAPTEKPEKKKKKKTAAQKAAAAAAAATATPEIPATASTQSQLNSEAKPFVSKANQPTEQVSKGLQPSALQAPLSGAEFDQLSAVIEKAQADVGEKISSIISQRTAALQSQILKDKQEQNAAFDAKQEVLLRMVSQTLSENVEATLGNVVKSAIAATVVPSIASTTRKALSEQIGAKLNAYLKDDLTRELQGTISHALVVTLKNPELLKGLSDTIAKGVGLRVEQQFASILAKSITPAFTSLAVQTSKKVADDVYSQASEQIAALEKQREVDNMKIERLTQLVTSLTQMVSSMAETQTSFQNEILHSLQTQNDKHKLDRLTQMVGNLSETVAAMGPAPVKQQEPAHHHHHHRQSSRQSSVNRPFSSSAVISPRSHSSAAQIAPSIVEASPVQPGNELETLAALMEAGNPEEACMRWLHSNDKQAIFDEFFSKFDPAFTQRMNPLVLLSLCTTLSSNLETKTLLERVDWLENILQTFTVTIHRRDPQNMLPADLTPRILEPTIERLDSLSLRVREISPQDPLVGRLVVMSNNARNIISSLRGGR